MWNTVVSRGRLGALALFLSLPGCTAICDTKYELGQKIRTSQAWHEFDGCNEQCFTGDYRSGWKAGYYDVTTGGTGCPPVIPPKKYWKPPVFLEHDPSRRNDWYCGFQDGAACAKCQPDHHYLPTFLPGPVCCQTCPVSGNMVPGEPVDFPMEHVESGSDTNGVTPSPVPEGGQTPPIETPPADAAPPTEPSAADPAAKEPAKDYDKDPEPSNTRREIPSDFISRTHIVTKVSNPPKQYESLLQQLVQNAADSSTVE